MCGICGILSDDPRSDVAAGVRSLAAELAHRGPDGLGVQVLSDPGAVFGHRRLSIVDLEHGAQPMANEDGRVWVTLNGEIYNHLELRRELEQRGHRFRTRADTEVLVHGWEEWGPELLGRLNGIYAFGLCDGRRGPRGAVVLARDPVGVKPLYLGVTGHRLWFASELAAARRSGLVEGSPERAALAQYLVYRFIPSPRTPFAAAWKVPPGHYLELDLSRPWPRPPRFTPFESRFAPGSTPRSAAEWEEALVTGLRGAVSRQLMSDVPVGSLLSGGVDSTLVTQYMRQASSTPPLCFGIGFADAPDASELEYVRRAAAVLNVPLEVFEVPEAQYLAEWPRQIRALGEPIANSGTLLVKLLCRSVRAHRKVVLSGQGADEPLGGYPRHAFERWYSMARRLRPLLAVVPSAAMAGDRLARVRRMAAEPDAARRYAETLAVFGLDEAAAMTGLPADGEELIQPVRYWVRPDDNGDTLNQLLRVDARLSLADDLLIVADHTSMAESVELRVPFLDLEFLALVDRMPGRFKVSLRGERKWLYRRAAARELPPALRAPLTGWRARIGRKLGFATPLERWFAEWASRYAGEFLVGRNARLPAFLATDGLRRILQGPEPALRRHSRQLLSLYVLEVWLRGTVDDSGSDPSDGPLAATLSGTSPGLA